MNWAIDIAFAVIIIIFMIVGAKRGFARSALDLVAIAVTLLLSLSVATPAAASCYDSFLSERIEAKLNETIKTQNMHVQGSVSELVESLPDFIQPYAEQQLRNLDDRFIAQGANETKATFIAKVEEQIVRPVTIRILSALLFTVFFVLLGIVLAFVARLIAGLFKHSAIHTADAVLGATLGLAKSLVLVVFASIFLVFLSTRSNGALTEAVKASYCLTFLKDTFPSLFAF